MNGVPDHEQLRRDLESAASRARSTGGGRAATTGRTVLIGLLVAVPAATVVLTAIATSGQEPGRESAPVGGARPSETAVVPTPPRRTGPRAPATSTGPDQPPQPEPPPDADRPLTHTVQPGETLARIALRHRVPLEQLAQQNGIADPDRLRAGQNLVVGPAPADETVIPPGATLSGLAAQHGTTVARLLALNPGITDPDRIVAGARLRLPRPPG